MQVHDHFAQLSDRSEYEFSAVDLASRQSRGADGIHDLGRPVRIASDCGFHGCAAPIGPVAARFVVQP